MLDIKFFFEHIRIARTLLATNVFALGALRCSSNEEIVAPVAVTADPLLDRFADQILTTGAGGNRKHRQLGLLLLRTSLLFRCSSGCDLRLRLFLLLLFFGLGGRITSALLAAHVLAVDADLVGTKRGLAAVTGATNSHANRFLDAFDVQVARRYPLFGLQGESILGEQSARLLLLHGAPMARRSSLLSGSRILLLGGDSCLGTVR